MMYNFQEYSKKLSEHSDIAKRTIVEKYSKYGNLSKDIRDQIWYKEYVSLFSTIEYQVPNLWKEGFDWKLLMQLAAASFSSELFIGKLDDSNNLPSIKISVENNSNILAKTVNELFPFQIDRLYEIYTEEQMNLQNHYWEDLGEEKTEIDLQRAYRVKKWESQLFDYQSRKEVFELVMA